MNSSLSSILSLVSDIKEEMFLLSERDIHTFVSPSAYDTAWLAMIPDPAKTDQPLFKCCLDWVLENQNGGGFWGETFAEDNGPTIDALPATLSCLIALKTWNVGEENIRKGLAFFHSKAEIILKANYQQLPPWFAIVFPALVELARAKGLDLALPRGPNSVFSDVLHMTQQILNTKKLQDDSWQYNTPLLSYLECLHPSFQDDHGQNILNNLGGDGSLFQSPSATAKAYMETGNIKCLEYLMSLVEKQPNGVPATYPMDRDLIRLSMVDQVQRLGLAEHFSEEIDHILKQIYENLRYENLQPEETYLSSTKLYKDALAFRLLRLQGYNVNPSSFCWFLHHPNFLEYIENNYEHQTSVLYTVYRATDLMYNGEFELEKARSFSRKLLAKSMSMIRNMRDDNIVIFPGLQKIIEHELAIPWIARLDHLDHRMWIEESENSPLWVGKASFYRLCCLNNEKLMQLAAENYKFRQSIYAKELEEVKRWSVESGLANIGFGREKTTYSYFGIAASSCLPHDSIVRIMCTKIAALVTVADDFYDMEGSLPELEVLTDAVQKWDGENLTGHGKIIFDALDDLVTKTALAFFHTSNGSIFLKAVRDIWKETFLSWMIEKTWSETGYQPSMDEYLHTGMISIAAHTVILPSSFFLGQNLAMEVLNPAHYTKITKLLMAVTRLVNDTQSYQKELLDGKLNMVLLHLKENPELHIDDSIAYVKDIVDQMTKEFLQFALIEECSDIHLPKAVRLLHLSGMKVFHMFFNSTNLFDTKEDLMDDIKQAIYLPPHHHHSTDEIPISIRIKPQMPPLSAPEERKETFTVSACFQPKIKVKKYHGSKMFKKAREFFKNPISSCGGAAIYAPLKF